MEWVTGPRVMVRREVFESVGVLDEGYFLYFEEVDLALNARRAGWPCWYVPTARVMHVMGKSTGLTDRDKVEKGRVPAYGSFQESLLPEESLGHSSLWPPTPRGACRML